MRDQEGRPRATLEVEDGQVWQVKGIANGTIVGPDRVVLLAFIRKHGYEVKDDHHNLRLRRYDFRCKPQELDHRLHAGGGLRMLRENRFASIGSPVHTEVKTLLCQVISTAGQLSPATLECLYQQFCLTVARSCAYVRAAPSVPMAWFCGLTRWRCRCRFSTW